MEKSFNRTLPDNVSPQEADDLIARIVRKTRSHHLLKRGAGARASLALREIFQALSVITGRLDRGTIARASLIALPHRIQVASCTPKSAHDIIREINQEILWKTLSLEYADPFRDHAQGPGSGLVEEIVDFQNQQFSREARIKNLHAEYVRRHEAGKEIDPEKLSYENLSTMMHDLEARGIVQLDEEGDGYRLQGRALLCLLQDVVDNDMVTGRHRRHRQYLREKSHVRRFLKGDTYHAVSPRHTMKRAVQRGKTMDEVHTTDLRCYEKMPAGDRDIAVCLDVSESMRQGAKLRYAKVAATGIARSAVHNGDRVGLVFFSNDADVGCPLTTKINRIVESLVYMKARRYTNIGDGIKEGRRLLLKDNRFSRKLIIVISDGLPNLTSGKGPACRTDPTDSGEMDNFMTSFGAEQNGGDEFAVGSHTDLQLLFQNMVASDHAVKETLKSRRSGIEVSFLYIGSTQESGELFARRIAQSGGGTCYTIRDIRDLPPKAMALL